MENEKRKSTIIKTFDGDIYIIRDQSPEELAAAFEGMDDIKMPNGSYIHRKSISAMQSYEDYTFQTEQRVHHKKGHRLHGGEWYDGKLPLGIKAGLERITGEINTKLPPGVPKLELPYKQDDKDL